MSNDSRASVSGGDAAGDDLEDFETEADEDTVVDGIFESSWRQLNRFPFDQR